ncbi:MAG: hypothetical protein H5T98_08140 [Syntrophomonadaceae bacterium]|nr:hypothetical protein [Syntrophomonadaceae bacterium]
MKRFVDTVERYLIRFIVLGLVVLVLVQGMMTGESMRFYLSWGERMEGQRIELPASTGEQSTESDFGAEVNSPYVLLTISVEQFSSLPKAVVLVNGEKRGSFAEEELVLELMAGDVVEIDSTYYNFPVSFTVKKVSDNLAYPNKGQVFTANQSIVTIGKIIVK